MAATRCRWASGRYRCCSCLSSRPVASSAKIIWSMSPGTEWRSRRATFRCRSPRCAGSWTSFPAVGIGSRRCRAAADAVAARAVAEAGDRRAERPPSRIRSRSGPVRGEGRSRAGQGPAAGGRVRLAERDTGPSPRLVGGARGGDRSRGHPVAGDGSVRRNPTTCAVPLARARGAGKSIERQRSDHNEYLD